MTTPTTPAMTVQEALIARLRVKADVIECGEKIAWGSDSAIMREAAEALSDAERRATEAETERNREYTRAQEWMGRAERVRAERIAVEARCGLMREALERIAAQKLLDELEPKDREYADLEMGYLGCVMEARSILADPGGKSDQGEKEKA